ncbi:cysteine desulfurase family protein [Sphingoaurantiacus capsulatus]|uniref:Cysteine desulfurase n=1 Tax=Sphingoaurantiacus capsulatus TaxID=1771310 RepID=A0ABV7XFC4_9SPHN
MAAPIYLDYQATTPVDPAVAAAMQPFLLDRFGNPHSQHRPGWEAEAAVDNARAQIARLLNMLPEALVFTSGATEATNLALKGVLTAPGQARRRIVTVATEHSCVLDTAEYLRELGAELTVLGVDADGLIDLDAAAAAIGDDVAIVSVMAVNNEIGVIQPVAEVAALAKRAGAVMHCDAAQAFAKIPVDVDALGVDLLSLSGHKAYGPKGIGALYVRPGTRLAPQMHGGGQEGGGLRSGTLAPMLCVGFGKAAEVAAARLDADAAHVRELWDRALAALDVPYSLNGSATARWHGNLNLCFPSVDGARLLADLRGLAVSAGAACASAKGKPSHVLAALGLPDALAKASLRIGWGRFTTADEIDRAMAMINDAVRAQGVRAA